MGDAREGRTADGMIRTGVDRGRIRQPFVDLLDAVVGAVLDESPDASVFVYGSVATGAAIVGRSDVDVLTVGLSAGRASAVANELSARFEGECRGVELAAAQISDLDGPGDSAHGFRVFLRHYCVHLAGPATMVPTVDFPADARAARGFNGDIAQHARRWRAAIDRATNDDDVTTTDLAVRVARKTLLAVAGLVSVHDTTWTTDRVVAVRRWSHVDPSLAPGLHVMLGWVDAAPDTTIGAVAEVLDMVVDPVAERFAYDIGLWPD